MIVYSKRYEMNNWKQANQRLTMQMQTKVTIFILQIVSQPKTTTVPIGDPPPPDYMIPSILVCLFCFFPSGLVAIYFAHRVNTDSLFTLR